MHKLRFPHYFSHRSTRELKELYASTAIADIALAMVLLFEPIYFVAVLGWSVSSVLWFFAAAYFLYVLLLPLGGYLIARKGYKHAILYSIPFKIAYWLLLFAAAAEPGLIVLAAVALAVEKTLFWPAFHSHLAKYSTAGQRGRESSIIFVLLQISLIAGPFIGGLIAYYFGLSILLLIASALYFLMFIPLFMTPDVRSGTFRFKDVLDYYRRYRNETLTYTGFGEELLLFTVWPIFIFMIVPDFFNLGLLIALSTLVATIVSLYAGRLFDNGQSRKYFVGGVLLTKFIWIGRLFVQNVPGVFAADSMGQVGKNLFNLPITANVYELANREKILPFAVFFEQTLSIGKAAAAALGALLFSATGSFTALFLLAAAFSLLYLYSRVARLAH